MTERPIDSAQKRLDDVARYCRMMRQSMTVPAAEVAEDILAIITEPVVTVSSSCGTIGHANGCGCHLEPIPPVTIWEEASTS